MRRLSNSGEIGTLGERIGALRVKNGMSQSQLAKRLYLTRASVNAWELGISIPAVSTIVSLSNLFHVSTDYILGFDEENSEYVDIGGYTEEEKQLVYSLLRYFDSKHTEEE